MAIVETMSQWRHYLQGANHKVLMQWNRKNLENFPTSKVLCQRQAGCAEIVSSDDFVIEHLEETKHPTDGLSWRPDQEIPNERLTVRLLATLATTTIEWYDNIHP